MIIWYFCCSEYTPYYNIYYEEKNISCNWGNFGYVWFLRIFWLDIFNRFFVTILLIVPKQLMSNDWNSINNYRSCFQGICILKSPKADPFLTTPFLNLLFVSRKSKFKWQLALSAPLYKGPVLKVLARDWGTRQWTLNKFSPYILCVLFY